MSNQSLLTPVHSTTITVIVVEDDASVRTMLGMWIDEAEGFACCGVFPDVESALPQIAGERPDVVLIDIKLPGRSGIECVRQLKPHMPDTQFVMQTVYEDTDSIFEAISAGATGYLVKTMARDALIGALREVYAGGSAMSSDIARKVSQSLQPSKVNSADRLSRRENETVALLAQGYRYQEVSEALGVGIETVNADIRRIYGKLHNHFRTRSQHEKKFFSSK